MNKARTRFAPSPTGSPHIGVLRTALYAYALAKHENGDFILRIEDTDKKREVKGSREKIEELLTLFGLKWDEHYVQSERVEKGIYKKAAEKLEKSGHAYNEGGAIRLKIPKNEKIGFHDFVLDKDITWDTNTLEDLVLLKSNGFPTYHLAVVVDDNDMKISHVLRGHDWLPSTPIHLLVYQYLGFSVPEIGHLTDILDPEGGKLSKRKGSASCEGLLEEGYLPEAILNFVMLLGWAPKDNRELFTLEEFVEAFDPSGFQKANPIFNREKLDWFNGHYIRQKSDEELFKLLEDFVPSGADEEKVKKTIPLVKERITKLSDFPLLAGFIFESSSKIEPKPITPNYRTHISLATQTLEKLDNWALGSLNQTLGTLIQDNKLKTGDFYMDLRGTISGSSVTPPINESIEIIGKEDTIKRLKKGLEQAKK